MLPGKRHHLVRARGRAADTEAGVALGHQPARDRMEDLVEDLVPDPLRARVRRRGSANHSPLTGRWPARNRRSDVSVMTATFRAMRVGSSFVPDR